MDFAQKPSSNLDYADPHAAAALAKLATGGSLAQEMSRISGLDVRQ